VILVVSGSGSQLSAYAYGANRVILAIGAQKIVPDASAGLRRIRDWSLPREAERIRGAGVGCRVAKTLIIEADDPGRLTVVLVARALGF
jgi:hypothetical protein